MTQRILITGATSGIGKELALQYAAEGVILGLTGRREALLSELAEACRRKGARAEAYTEDVSDGPGMKAMAEAFLEAAGGIDLVIANAGMGTPDDLESGDPSRMSRLLTVNINGVINTIVPFVPRMKAQGSGHVVAIASIAGARALPHHTTYSATKACVRMLMDEGDKPKQRTHRVYRVVPNLPEMVVDEGSVLFGMAGLEVEKPVAGFSLPMDFRTESSTRALLFTQQREASVATADS